MLGSLSHFLDDSGFELLVQELDHLFLLVDFFVLPLDACSSLIVHKIQICGFATVFCNVVIQIFNLIFA